MISFEVGATVAVVLAMLAANWQTLVAVLPTLNKPEKPVSGQTVRTQYVFTPTDVHGKQCSLVLSKEETLSLWDDLESQLNGPTKSQVKR